GPHRAGGQRDRHAGIECVQACGGGGPAGGFGEELSERAPPAQSQCLKCLVSVNTMAMPWSSAALITSSSRTEPPGWITAVAPASAAAGRPSAEGENASDAPTEPLGGGGGPP